MGRHSRPPFAWPVSLGARGVAAGCSSGVVFVELVGLSQCSYLPCSEISLDLRSLTINQRRLGWSSESCVVVACGHSRDASAEADSRQYPWVTPEREAAQ